MTANFNKPIAEDQFLDVLTQIRDNLTALAKQDLSTASNVPEGAIQYSATNHRWEKRVNAVWEALSPLTQALDVRVHDSDRLGDEEPDYYRNADNINAGTLDVSRIDTEDSDYDSASETKVARISAVRALYNWIRNQLSTHTHTAQQISGILALARIPNIPARKITSGMLAQARIPGLPANKITSGVFDAARIPELPDNAPPGAVISFAASAPPSGWLECNGAFLSRTAYADLYATIGTIFGDGSGSTTFNLPDLRGEFIRGWDHGRGVDTNREFGSKQADEFKSHNHAGLVNTDGYTAGMNNGYRYHSPCRNAMGYAGGNETRPRNIAMLFCIKY